MSDKPFWRDLLEAVAIAVSILFIVTIAVVKIKEAEGRNIPTVYCIENEITTNKGDK